MYMPMNRRGFLLGSGATALVSLSELYKLRLAEARGGFRSSRELDGLLQEGLRAAKNAGARYADVRLHRVVDELVAIRDDHIEYCAGRESYGAGVRVVVDGAWGFASTSSVETAAVRKAAETAVAMARANARLLAPKLELSREEPHVAVWQTPLQIDPFRMSLGEKADYLLALAAAARKVRGVSFVNGSYYGMLEWKLIANSEGSYIEQELTRLEPNLELTAVDETRGGFETLAADTTPWQGGFEHVERMLRTADVERLAEELLEKAKAPSVTAGKRDLILAPSNLWLTIHESVGHPTELDRALGYEANFAGTSFATPDLLGRLEYASPIVTLYADKTTPGGLATCGYDDDCVKTQRYDLVKDGRLVGYQTTREQAAWIGETHSRGTAYAQDYRSFPFQRMPNVSLAPFPSALGLKDLIAATDDGIYIVGTGSWSIDQQRKNFQFGGQKFYEIKHGKLVRMVKDVAYQSSTLEFWKRCDLLGDASEWRLYGSMSDGKGEPVQSNAVSHGCPPARFRGVEILNTNRRTA